MHLHRLLVHHLQVHPAVARDTRGLVGHRTRVGTIDGEHGRDTRLILDLDEEGTPALLRQLRLRLTLLHLDATLGIDVDASEAMLVEYSLDLGERFDARRPFNELF